MNDDEKEKSDIELLALCVVTLSVLGYDMGITADKVLEDAAKVITIFLDAKYQRKN